MSHDIPPELATLLGAQEGPLRERAWAEFVERHTRLLLHVARSYGGDHDAVMDRYTYVLERLRGEDCHRLRTWAADRRSKLTTWLVIVTQRLCLDENRRRYGRPRAVGPEAVEGRRTRRRLADFLAEQLDHVGPEQQTDAPIEHSDSAVRRAELSEALACCVARLGSADQLLLTLRFQDGRSAADIARTLSFPSPFHVYRRLDRLLAELREALRARGVEDPVP
jgi:RNA polymerase sigma factor (sigma-70 family)